MRNNEEQINKRKETLFQLKKNIEDLEYKIKHSKHINVKNRAMRDLNITAKTAQLVAPYLVTAGIIAGGFSSLLGDIPFYPNDEWKVYAQVTTEIDNNGNFKTERLYNDCNYNNYSTLYYYSAWKKDENGLYSRSVQTYSINNNSPEKIIELIKKEDLNFEDIFGQPCSNITETKNNLTEDEFQEKPYIKAVLYNKDKNDYIIHQETVEENIFLSFGYLVLVFTAGYIIYNFKKDHIENPIEEHYLSFIDNFKRTYGPLDIEDLTQKLELKKNEYNKLTK